MVNKSIFNFETESLFILISTLKDLTKSKIDKKTKIVAIAIGKTAAKSLNLSVSK
jgi:hypothetical protein